MRQSSEDEAWARSESPARSELAGGAVRRRLSSVATEVAKAPERMFGEEKMERAKSQLASQWVMRTPTRVIVAYCSLPAVMILLLVALYGTMPQLASVVEGSLRTIVSCVSVVVAARLWAARQGAPRQQQRDEQLWIVLCLVLFAIRFEPVTWALYDSKLLSLWPLSYLRRSVAQGSVYVIMMFMTSVLDRLSRRGAPPRGAWFDALARSQVQLISVCWVCSEVFTNPLTKDAMLFSGAFVIVGAGIGCVWFLTAAQLAYLSIKRMDWHDAAAKAERLFLLALLGLMGMLGVAQLFVRQGQHHFSAKLAGLCALEFLYMLAHVFSPSNLSQTGEIALDFGV